MVPIAHQTKEHILNYADKTFEDLFQMVTIPYIKRSLNHLVLKQRKRMNHYKK